MGTSCLRLRVRIVYALVYILRQRELFVFCIRGTRVSLRRVLSCISLGYKVYPNGSTDRPGISVLFVRVRSCISVGTSVGKISKGSASSAETEKHKYRK